ncbi:MAG: SusD/RagB family nutrient-binding outer membrane lipoprotein [Bacteroidales bacterium]
MRKISKHIQGVAVALLMGCCFAACSEDTLDRINVNKDNPQNVPENLLVADLLVATAFYNVGGDFNTYLSSYIEHEVGVHNQLSRAEHREGEPQASSTFNNVWVNLYAVLKNARIAIDKGTANENFVTRGMARVLAAYTSALLTDMFGDTPWSEASLVTPEGLPVYMNPAIDKQSVIYEGIMTQLDEAIADLGSTDFSPITKEDLVYGGDAAAWIKFAYGLKARYTMRLLYRSTNKTETLNDVISYANLSFQSFEEQAALSIYDANNLNPLFDFQWSRDALAASQSLSDKLIARNDPRIRRVFFDPDWVQMTGADDPNFYMAPNGTAEEAQYTYNTSAFVYSQIAPTLYLSYHEVLFLKAEALCRLNNSADAKPILQEAITAAFRNMELSVYSALKAPAVMYYGGLSETSAPLTASDAEAYFTASVEPLFDANPLQEVMIQKYLAFFGASGESTECYNDVRRLKALGEDFILLDNPKPFPLRCPYGNADTTTNPEVKEAYGNGEYVYTENVWWAGGNR